VINPRKTETEYPSASMGKRVHLRGAREGYDLASKLQLEEAIMFASSRLNLQEALDSTLYSPRVQEPSLPTSQYWTSLLMSTYQPLEPCSVPGAACITPTSAAC